MKAPDQIESIESLRNRNATCREFSLNGWVIRSKEVGNSCECDHCVHIRQERAKYNARIGRTR